MTRARTAALLALLAAGPAAAQDFPTSPPPAGPLTPAPFPPFREFTLANGLRVIVVENNRLPILSLTLTFNAGRVADPAGREGLASMAADLLSKGAGPRDAEAFAEAIEGVGGSIGTSAGSDFLSVTAGVLSPHAELAFGLVADAVVRPAFQDAEIELVRTRTLSALTLEQSQPEAIADRQTARILYGEHPYGRRPTPASVRAITRDDLLAFQRDRLRPGGALLVVAGDLSAARVRQLATRAFAGWTGRPAALPPAPRPPARGAREVFLVHRPGAVQSNIVIANLALTATDPQNYAATVANRVLGGGADARLFMILREEKSWTYGAYSDFVPRRDTGWFEATAEVRTEVTDSAVTEMLAQLERMRTEPVPPDELEAARGALVGSYPLSIQTAEQVARAVAQARAYGLPDDYVQTYRVRLGAVTAEQVQAASRALLHPDRAAVVVVGDARALHERLAAIGPVTLLDTEGRPLAAAALAPEAAPLELDLAALAPRQDSMVIRMQGNALGFIRSRMERTDSGWRYTEETRIGPVVEQTTTLDVDAAGSVRRVRQRGTVQGEPTSIEVDYRGGRVTGQARTLTAEGPKSVTIDTTVVPGTLDDNAIQMLLPALQWAPGASWTVGVFSSGLGEYRVATLRVAEVETVTLDSGPVEAFRAEWTGLPQAVTFWVTTAAPHRLVKLGLAGAPLEIVNTR
jgi:zinc protease